MNTYFKIALSIFLFLGVSLTVDAQKDEQYGQASYYSDKHHGKSTSSGVQYDKKKLTCAHNDHAFGTKLRVTHLENKKSVIVEVTDRGPYIKGRIVEISSSAAKIIDLIDDEITQVKVEVVKNNSKTEVLTDKGDKKPTEYSTPTNRKSVEESIKKEKAKEESSTKSTTNTKKKEKAKAPKEEKKKKEKKEVAPTSPTPSTASKGGAKKSLPMMTGKDLQNADLYQITLLKPKKEGFGVQVASLSDYEGVLKKVAELQGKWFTQIFISTENVDRGANVYKIILGQFETRDQANSYKKILKKNKKISGFVVPLG